MSSNFYRVLAVDTLVRVIVGLSNGGNITTLINMSLLAKLLQILPSKNLPSRCVLYKAMMVSVQHQQKEWRIIHNIHT